MGDYLMQNPMPVPGARVHTSAADNEAMKAHARTLMEICRLAVLATFGPEGVQTMGPSGVAGCAIQAAVGGVLKTETAADAGTFEVMAFSVGLALGEVLRHGQMIDLEPIMSALGNGVAHSLEANRMPVGGIQ